MAWCRQSQCLSRSLSPCSVTGKQLETFATNRHERINVIRIIGILCEIYTRDCNNVRRISGLVVAYVSQGALQYPIRRLIVRYHKVSKHWDLYSALCCRSDICRPLSSIVCQISKRCDNLNYQSRGFETSHNFKIRGIEIGPAVISKFNKRSLDFLMRHPDTNFLIKCASYVVDSSLAWWRHQMETFSASLALCAGNSPVPGEFPAQRPVTRSFDIFFDLHLYKRLSKQPWGWWFETPPCPLWRHCDECFTWDTSNFQHWIIYRVYRVCPLKNVYARLAIPMHYSINPLRPSDTCMRR